MLYYILLTLYVLNCFVLVLIVLLQQGKGGDIASAFGGGGSQVAFGARAGATVLTRATAVSGAIFILGALVLTTWGHSGPGSGSVLGGRAPATQQQVPAPAQPLAPPVEPAPQAPADAPAQ